MKNVRSSQPCISMDFCIESSSSMAVSLTKMQMESLKGAHQEFEFQKVSKMHMTTKPKDITIRK